MQKIILPIDTKSLYLNIKNDNTSGHTATVSTPIKQGNSMNEKLTKVYSIDKQIDFQSKPDLINELVKNSKSQVRVTNVFIFDKVGVNGKYIEIDKKNFCIYIKEEVDPNKTQYGRLKLHYPLSLKYEDIDIDIDNKYIMTKISEQLKKYAFIVDAFEYDIETKMLNFKVTIIGENEIPYSKVFLKNKGVGNKYTNIFNEVADSYDMEIISLKKIYGDDIDAENYNLYYFKNKDRALELVEEYLNKMRFENIKQLSKAYPYSLYDIEYVDNGITKFVQVYFTTTNIKYFNLSSKRLKFLNDFNEDTKILVITSITSNPEISIYGLNDVIGFSKTINSMMIKDVN